MFRSRVLVFWSVLKVSEMIKTLKWTPILLLKYSILTVVTGDSCRGRFTKVSHQNGFIVFLLKGRQPMKNHEFCLLGQFGGHLCFNPAQAKRAGALDEAHRLQTRTTMLQTPTQGHLSPNMRIYDLYTLTASSKSDRCVTERERASILHQTGIAKLTSFFVICHVCELSEAFSLALIPSSFFVSLRSVWSVLL